MNRLLAGVLGLAVVVMLALITIRQPSRGWVTLNEDEMRAINIGESKSEILQRLGPAFIHVPAKVSTKANPESGQEILVGEAHVAYQQRDRFCFRTRIDLWFDADRLRSVYVKRRLIGSFEYMDGPIYSLSESGTFVGEDFEEVFRKG